MRQPPIPAGRVEVEVGAVRGEVVGRVDTEPPGDRVGPGTGLGVGAARPGPDHLRRPGVVGAQLQRIAYVGQPVGAAVPDIAGDGQTGVDDHGDDGRRRSSSGRSGSPSKSSTIH